MKTRFAFVLALCAGAAIAQVPDYQAMMADMEKAQAAAMKPGDDKLTCAQLEAELVAVVQHPEFQHFVMAAGADAQKQQQALKAAQGEIATQSLRTALMATMPGAAAPGMAAMQAEAMAKGAQATMNMQARMLQAQKMMVLMPKLMRGQRVVELGVVKRCAWAMGAM